VPPCHQCLRSHFSRSRADAQMLGAGRTGANAITQYPPSNGTRMSVLSHCAFDAHSLQWRREQVYVGFLRCTPPSLLFCSLFLRCFCPLISYSHFFFWPIWLVRLVGMIRVSSERIHTSSCFLVVVMTMNELQPSARPYGRT